MAKGSIGSTERRRRKVLVAKWRRGGLSAAGFAEEHGISQWALYRWARQLGVGPRRRRETLRPVRNSSAAGSPAFLPVRVVGDGPVEPPARTEGVVEIQLRSGDVVRVVGDVGAERLRAVMTAVRQAC